MSPDYLQQADQRTLGASSQWNQESPWNPSDDEKDMPDWLRPQASPMNQSYYPQSYQQPWYQQPQQQPPQQQSIKNFLQSKTIWAGVVTAMASVCSYFQGSEAIQANPQATSAFGIGIGVLIVLLRLLTDKAVAPPKVTIYQSKPPGWPK